MNAAGKKKIVIDARPLARPRSGIRRYLENIIVHLLEHQEVEWMLYSDAPFVSDVVDPALADIRIAGASLLGRLLWSLKVRSWLERDNPDVYWTPRHHLPLFLPSKIRSVVTMHDMVWVTHPDTMRMAGLWVERLITGRSIARADSIIAVSRSTANDVFRHAPGAEQKTVVIRHGFTELPPPIEQTLVREGNYMLSVGTVEPRKNYSILIKAYLRYVQQGGLNKLVIVGNKGWGWDEFRRGIGNPELKDRLHYVENCNDRELSGLYNGASVFISVSVAEGYGLPVIEAAGYGLPMILSNIEIYHEHELKDVFWVSPCDIEGLSVAMKELESAPAVGVKNKEIRQSFPTWKSISNEVFLMLSSERRCPFVGLK